MALTDYGNMFGALEFYFQAQQKNIKPILATEMYYVEDYNTSVKDFRNPLKAYKTLVLLARNSEAYKNLCHINAEAYEKSYYGFPRASYSLFERNKEGLIALTGGGRGRVPWLFHNKGKEASLREIKILQKIFKSDLYLELLPKGVKDCEKYNLFLAEVAKDLKLCLVAAGDVHYVEKKEALIQDTLYCIGTNKTLTDKKRDKLGPSEFYFKSSKEMETLFKDHKSIDSFYKEACQKTLEIAEQCSIHFKIKDKKGYPIYHLPQVVSTKTKKSKSGDLSESESLKTLSQKGLESRFKEASLRGEESSSERKKEYQNRLDYELQIIEKMGFNGYFYIVYDFIHWAKENNVPVGPGRGSGASSLVSYCLGITDLDPMPLNLIFERFLNPERISMPDFDIDFCQEKRHKVLEYITKKYGKDCSSHVITYGRLSVRAAIRDVGRVLALRYSEVDQVAKLIPDILGITLAQALKKEPRLKEMAEEDPKIAELLQLTGLLEGLVRHVSIHAAGIIIADNPIVNYAPLYKGAEGENVLQYDLKYAEKIGLVKFDFLGLKTLTLMAETFRLIKQNKGKTITTGQISLKDSGIYEIMSMGDTAGIFQFEGTGITDLLIKSQPTCFEDIVAINALYRPGPMSMIPSYLDRKKARVPVEYIFPDLEPILKETYGIIVYQEQVQQIAVQIAGYSYGEADVLRRAMGKKIRSAMEKQKTRFLKGAKSKNHNLKKAEELFDLMAEFAKYGFNKSHAAAYCVLAAQTAWLKNYYPMEFLAAQMTIEQNDSDKLAVYVRDAKKHGFKVRSPHVNSSSFRFIIDKGDICFSLAAIKGLGAYVAKDVVKAREFLKDKKFSSIEEFFETVDVKKINKKTLESLIKAGALDGFGLERGDLMHNIEKFSSYASQKTEDKSSGQQNLLSLLNTTQINISKAEPWSRRETLSYEKEVLGFYLNDHPIKVMEGLENSLNYKTLFYLKDLKNTSKPVGTLAMVSDVREVLTKRGELMAFALLEDGSHSMEAVFFPEVYDKLKRLLLQVGDVFHITGRIQKDKNTSQSQLVAENIMLLDDFLKPVKKIKIELYPHLKTQQLIDLNNLLLNSKKGKTCVNLSVFLPSEKVMLNMDTKSTLYDIEINHDFLQRTRRIFKNVKNIRLYKN